MHFLIIGFFLFLFLIVLPLAVLFGILYLITSAFNAPQEKTRPTPRSIWDPNPYLPPPVEEQPIPDVKMTVLHESVVPPHLDNKKDTSIATLIHKFFFGDINNIPPAHEARRHHPNLVHRSQFFVKRKILTKTEHKFLLYLMQARPEGIAIACKVGLWGVVRNIQKSDWNKISQKHLDFVLYDLRKNDVLLVIELDDPSHLKERAQQRDRAKDSILNDAGIPILRIPTSKTYDINVLREKILARISHAGT